MSTMIKGEKCNRCGYEWKPQSESTPVKCPDCGSPYWNKERKYKIKIKTKIKENKKGIKTK
jgi:predicted Zn-ribbon and HTH transcriptional regulator